MILLFYDVYSRTYPEAEQQQQQNSSSSSSRTHKARVSVDARSDCRSNP